MSDGNLRPLFRKHILDFHWQSVETGGTGRGIPDTNYCFGGVEGWIEFKEVCGWKVELSPEQVAWHERRYRAKGRTFIALRKRSVARQDDLYLFRGSMARVLFRDGLKDHLEARLTRQEKGPARWDWPLVRELLLS